MATVPLTFAHTCNPHVTVCAAPSADKVDCSKIDEVLDEMGGAQGMTFMNDKYKLATSADELTARCTEGLAALKTLKRYNKECYTSLTQQVFSAILRTRVQFNEKRCVAGSESFTEAHEGGKCLVDNSSAAVKEAERQTIVGSQVLHEMNIPEKKNRLRRSCCAVLASRTNFLEAAKTKCAKYEKLYIDYVDSYTSEAMGLICDKPEELKCSELEPLKLAGVEPKYKFFMTPTLKVVQSLDDS